MLRTALATLVLAVALASPLQAQPAPAPAATQPTIIVNIPPLALPPAAPTPNSDPGALPVWADRLIQAVVGIAAALGIIAAYLNRQGLLKTDAKADSAKETATAAKDAANTADAKAEFNKGSLTTLAGGLHSTQAALTQVAAQTPVAAVQAVAPLLQGAPLQPLQPPQQQP